LLLLLLELMKLALVVVLLLELVVVVVVVVLPPCPAEDCRRPDRAHSLCAPAVPLGALTRTLY
jgi:hypothetical protein